MEAFPFTRNYLSPIEQKSLTHPHRANTQQSNYFFQLNITRVFQDEIPINPISKEMIKKCSIQIQCNNTQFKFIIKDIKDKDRAFLIKKISKVIEKFSYSQFSYYSAIQLMDIIRQKIKIKLSIEDIAIGSLIIAIKFNENYNDICSLKAVQSAFESKFYYSNDLLRELEMLCLKCIDHDLNIVSPFIALEHIISRNILFPSDNPKESFKQLTERLSNEARELLGKIVKKTYMYIKYDAFLLSLSIICFIRHKNDMPKWNEVFVSLYSISLKDIMDCYWFIEGIIPKANSNHSQNIVITSDYQPFRDNNTNDNNHPNSKYKQIKVNVSSSLNELRLVSPSNYQKTIDSYNWKSQRSTSASLDETPLVTKYPIRSNYSHHNFNHNSTKTKLPNKKQVNLLYKPIKKFLCSNIDYRLSSASSRPIMTEPVTVTQTIKSQMNKRNSNKKQKNNKIIKAFKKNSVLIIEPNLKKSIIESQTHRVIAKTKLNNNSKDNAILSIVDYNHFKEKKSTNKTKQSHPTMKTKDILNKSQRANNFHKGYLMLNKINKLKPYITLTNLNVKLHHKQM